MSTQLIFTVKILESYLIRPTLLLRTDLVFLRSLESKMKLTMKEKKDQNHEQILNSLDFVA